MKERVTCYRCNLPMVPQPEPLDLSWAGDGPNAADIDFRGILVEVYRCLSCAGVATRPVTIHLPERARLAAAV
ncbi:MAG TPA: hypothetical protein VKH43_07295 [Thermoanaerobaculia bacterium]|nr:hypothetical protein [Thermoanaerobaculia bacterium]